MDPRVGLYEALLVVAAFGTATVAAYTWRRRDEPGARFLVVVLVSTTAWAILSLTESLVPGSRLALVSVRLVYLFVPVIVAGVLLFAMVYTGRDQWIVGRTYAALAVEPILVNLTVWTNDVHGLFFETVVRSETTRAGWEITAGPAFWAHALYSYALVFVATIWLVRFALRTEPLYQRQVYGILVSLFPPWIGNILFLSGIVDIDLTPIAFATTGIGLSWAILQNRFLDIAPTARDTVVDTITDGVIVVDEDDVIIDCNPAAYELLDRDASVVGTPITDLIDDRPELLDRYDELKRADGERSVAVEVGDRYFSVAVSPLSDVRGERLGAVFVVHDVTEQRHRELQLQRRNEQLDHFAGVVSHDLRNPLHVASDALELARETGEEQHFNRVEYAHERMEQLIEDLLTLARQGQQIDDRQPVSLATLARTSWETVATEDASLTVDGETTILADPNRLQQLLENLYRNSVEHAGSAVTVRVRPTEDGFLVEDDGPGIPPSVREAVLEAGYSTVESDVGIGLTVVRHVAEAHGWTLTIGESRDGGACFRFDGVETAD